VSEYVWLLPEVVLSIHGRQIAEHGGEPGLRDEGLFESALARPKNLLAYGEPPPDIAALAAAYAFGLCKNHPFIDGNKRVGYVAARTFLLLNERDISAPPEEKYMTMLSLAEGRLSEQELAQWIRERMTKQSE
jgi:death on curing protein